MLKSGKRVSFDQIKNGIISTEKLIFSQSSDQKKGKGLFYTPDFVVDYILDKTILYSLNSKLSKILGLKELTNFKEALKQRNVHIASLLYHQILPQFTICDIAMGWGIFLLRSFDFLFDIYLTCSNLLKSENYGNFSSLGDETIKEKIIFCIIRNNLYGLDISSESVYLAKLKLYEHAFKNTKSETLPFITPNFIVSNSLLGYDFLQECHVGIKNIDKEWEKKVLSIVSQKDINFAKKWLMKQPFIHWFKQFSRVHACGGFDVIVGNPPYINVKKLNLGERRVYKSIYSTYNSNGDISNIFWERALNLCKRGGLISFITPRYWLEGTDSDSLRQFLLSNSTIREIIDFRSNRTVFYQRERRLGVDTAIVSIEKKLPGQTLVDVYFLNKIGTISHINKANFSNVEIKQAELTDKRWIFGKTPIIDYMEDHSSYYLGDDKKSQSFTGICSIGKGCSTGNNNIFCLKKLSKSTYEGYNRIQVNLPDSEVDGLRLLIKNRDIQQFFWNKSDQYWIFLKGKNIEDYPTLFNYLKKYKSRLESSKIKYKLKEFYDYVAYRSLSLINRVPKIICPYQNERNKFALVDENSPSTINETDVITLAIKDEFIEKINWYYLLAVLNSTMIQYYTQIVNKKVFNLYDFRTNQIARIPIPKLLNQENFQKIVKTVINLRLIQNRDLSRDIQNLQKSLVVMLNNLVFEVYFRDKISSSLNEVIEEENLFLLEKDVTDRNIERSYKKYLDLVNNKPVSTQIHKILSFPEVVEVKKSLDHC